MRAAIFKALTGAEIPLKPAQLAVMLGESHQAVRQALLRMARADPPLAFRSANVFGAYEAAVEGSRKF